MTDPLPAPESPSAAPVMVHYRGQTIPEPPGVRLHALMAARGLRPELTLAVVNGVLVRADVALSAGDRVTLVPVMSGG